MSSPVDVPEVEIDDLRAEAQRALLSAQLVPICERIAPGPYGLSRAALELLEALECGAACLLAVRRALVGRIAADRRRGFAGGEVSADEQRFCSLLAVATAAGEALAELDLDRALLPPAERHLKLEEYRELLCGGEAVLLPALLDDLRKYLEFYRNHPEEALRPKGGERLQACAGSYLALLASTAARLGDDGEHAAALQAARERGLVVRGVRYRGFTRAAAEMPQEERALIEIWPDDIVGNEQMLDTGLALARAVAGFDLERGVNPQQIRNPVLFALGAPGCGKTVTAHAIGNYFLDLCRRHGIPARFRVIRRTDWASHYQNKSANELLRIFREEVFDFPGVAGVYWPDIDTAFAARDDPGVRAEEKAILGTLFGLLDGTVGPRNGKWFMIADANYLTMDKATLSRLTQDPCRAGGPTTPEAYATLLRDKKLALVADALRIDDAEWQAFGALCVEHRLSGRAVDNLAGKLLAQIADVELPDEYFSMTFEQKSALLGRLRRTVCYADLEAAVERYVAFERQAEEEAQAERFARRVAEIREQLAARVAAIGEPGE